MRFKTSEQEKRDFLRWKIILFTICVAFDWAMIIFFASAYSKDQNVIQLVSVIFFVILLVIETMTMVKIVKEAKR